MLAPARMPVADGKKIENKLKKEPSGPRQLGTKFWAKMSAGEEAEEKHLGPSNRLSPDISALDGGTSLMVGNPWEEDIMLPMTSSSKEHFPIANFSPNKEQGSSDVLGPVEGDPNLWWTHLDS